MSINRHKTLEEQIRKLKRNMNAIVQELKEMREEMNERFDGLENRMDKLENGIKDFKIKTGKSFVVVAGGFKAAGHESFTNELKEIWKDDVVIRRDK